jgi:hypothetical protein
MQQEAWQGEERRKKVRRESDREVCAFHKIKCGAIAENKTLIHQIEEKMATREDIRELKGTMSGLVPKWAFVLFVTTSITIGGFIGGAVLYGVRESNKEIKTVSGSMHEVKANQKVLMKSILGVDRSIDRLEERK